MKKSISLFSLSNIVVVCLLLATSCKKSDTAVDYKSLIIGKWAATKTEWQFIANTTGAKTSGSDKAETGDAMEFKTGVAGINYSMVEGSVVTDNFQYTINGNQLTITQNAEPNQGTGTVSSVFTISTITANSLVITFQEKDIDFNDDGIKGTLTNTVYYSK